MRRLLRFLFITLGALTGLVIVAALVMYGISEMQLRKTYAAEGDLVGTRATLRGTHRGELYGLPPTGKAIAWDFFSFARVADGAVVEHNGSADWTAALFHLGLVGT